jgi:hypothetical protein
VHRAVKVTIHKAAEPRIGARFKLERGQSRRPALPRTKCNALQLRARVREKRRARRVDLIGLEPTTSSMPFAKCN